ncbi:triose-phosphate isomerase [Orrella marina]|nr:triose-phosphate isomerase [Orrella marina]
MNGSLSSNSELIAGIAQRMSQIGGATDVAVCVPFPYLSQAADLLKDSGVSWGAQDVSARESGAYTGEVSAPMLAEFGCRWVLVGHSERRSLHGESDAEVADKAAAALSKGITPVVCVGESLEERDAGQVQAVIERQLKPVLALGDDAVARLVIAYEPVWAIGTGRSATPEQAQEVHAFVRGLLPAGAKGIPLLYGGSVKPDNAQVLFGMQDIDGALVGGASLVSKDFMAIAEHGSASR